MRFLEIKHWDFLIRYFRYIRYVSVKIIEIKCFICIATWFIQGLHLFFIFCYSVHSITAVFAAATLQNIFPLLYSKKPFSRRRINKWENDYFHHSLLSYFVSCSLAAHPQKKQTSQSKIKFLTWILYTQDPIRYSKSVLVQVVPVTSVNISAL